MTDQGRDADAGDDHAAELLQALQEARRHDRHGHDRGRRVLEDLQARRRDDSHQPAAQARERSGRDLPHRTTRNGTPSSRKFAKCTRRGGRCWLARSRSKSRKCSAKSSGKYGIKHDVLTPNTTSAKRRSSPRPGVRAAVTIATNMAGRGTDIILGGNPEYLTWDQLRHHYAVPTRRSQIGLGRTHEEDRQRGGDDRRRRRGLRRWAACT